MTAARVGGALLVAVLALVAVLVAEASYVWGTTSPAQTATRPVVIGDIAAQYAVRAAAADTARIFSTSWRRYDRHVSRATTLMTPAFAAAYRRGAEPVRASVVASRTTTTTVVSASGVVAARPDQVVALLFLDQYTASHGRRSQSPRRALVTMERSDHGWLVGNVQTQ